MKFSTVLIIGLIILISLTPYSKASVLENEHYIICGHVYEPCTHDTVLIENVRTGEVLEIKLRQFEPDKKEYQVTIANFPSGWDWSDTITVTYGNKTVATELTKGDVGNQVDFNRPFDIDPMTIITGTILILSSSGLYYRIKRGKNMSENGNQPEETAEDEQPEFIPYFDRIFGGTKRGWIMVTSLFLFAALAAGIAVPDELMKIYQIVIGMWFSVGGLNAVRTVGN